MPIQLCPFKVCSSNAEVCAEIGKNSHGVGIGDLYAGIPGTRRIPLIVDNRVVDASEENVLNGSYPLVRPFILIFDKSQCAVMGDCVSRWFVLFLVEMGKRRL
jgi:hypothetical protein